MDQHAGLDFLADLDRMELEGFTGKFSVFLVLRPISLNTPAAGVPLKFMWWYFMPGKSLATYGSYERFSLDTLDNRSSSVELLCRSRFTITLPNC